MKYPRRITIAPQANVLLKHDIVVQDEDGPLHFLRPHETGFDNLLTVEALDGISWANPAVYENKLIVRNATTVVCYELPITRE